MQWSILVTEGIHKLGITFSKAADFFFSVYVYFWKLWSSLRWEFFSFFSSKEYTFAYFKSHATIWFLESNLCSERTKNCKGWQHIYA